MSYTLGSMGASVYEPQTDATGGETINIQYVERPGLLGISIKNFLLNIITLGFYRFWAKTNTRRHVWSCIQINGEPLEYTGTGKELFLGFLVIFGIILLPFIIIIGVLQASGNEILAAFVQYGFGALMLVFYGMAIYRARRYRLSRTVWRGIRGSLVGSSWSYSLLHLGKMLLASITLGWSNPAMNLLLQKRITNEMAFGDTQFYFFGKSEPLYSRYAFCWFAMLFVTILLIVVLSGVTPLDSLKEFMNKTNNQEFSNDNYLVLALIFACIMFIVIVYGVIWTFYTAREMALFAEFTKFGSASFHLNTTTPSLIWLWLGNILLIVFTLGVATPYTVQRIFRYMCDRLEVNGWVDISAIQQSTARIDKRGEGLMDAFDLDGI